MHMEEAANLISSLHQTLSEVDAVVANVNERSKRTILHIETAAQRLLQTITEHRHKLVSKVCAITEAKLHALQGEKELVQDHFRAVEDVLRCAQNTGAVEDAEQWEKALTRQLNNLKEAAFDFQEYDEDMKFHFLYRDEKLLAAICKFGDVFTVPNEGNPKGDKEGSHGAVIQLTLNEEDVEESVEQFDRDNDHVNGDVLNDERLLLEFQENLSSPDQVTVSQTNFAGAVLTLAFEDTEDVTQLKADTNSGKELINEERTPIELQEIKRERGDLNEMEEGGDDEAVQDTIPEENNRSGCSGRVEHPLLTSEHHNDEVISPVDQETLNTATEDELIKDLNSNGDKEWL